MALRQEQRGSGLKRVRTGVGRFRSIGATRGAIGAMPPKKFLEHIVILCFERRFFKQNSVIRIISNIPPPKYFGPSQIFELATPLSRSC